MLKRLLLCIYLLGAAAPASAINYTDLWYLATEAGWGVNVVQSDTFMFVTFFIYGPDKKPIWYSGQLFQDSKGNFNGSLYTTTGTFYGTSPWNPADQVTGAVGTVSFQPTSPTTAKLTYTVTTPAALAATVTKTIQRQTLTPITIGGTYVGSQSGAYSACTSNSNNTTYTDAFGLLVTQTTGGSVTFQFTYASGLSCTFTGTLTQTGQLYNVTTANYSCSDGLSTTASISELRATSLGIEGRFGAASVGGGCREDAVFGGPLK